MSQEAVYHKVYGASGKVRDAGLSHESTVWVFNNSEKQRLVLQNLHKPIPMLWTKIINSSEGNLVMVPVSSLRSALAPYFMLGLDLS